MQGDGLFSDRNGGSGPRFDVARAFRFGLAWIAAALLLAMMALTVVDVLGRYLMSAPVKGSTELTELMLIAVIFIGLPAASLDREHVTVDLLTDRLRPAARRLLSPLVGLFAAAVLSVIAWRLWLTGAQFGSYGGTTASLEIPVAPFGYLAALMTGLAALITLGQLWPAPRREG